MTDLGLSDLIYVGEASDEDKRRVVQEVERSIKMIAHYDADKGWICYFCEKTFQYKETDIIINIL